MKRTAMCLLMAGVLSATTARAAVTDGWEWTNYSNHNNIFSIARQDDFVWAGTDAGLLKWTIPAGGDEPVYVIVDEVIPQDYYVNTITVRDGVVWFAVEGMGIVKYDGTTWTSWGTANSNLLNDWTWDIDFDSGGNLWVASSGGVSRFDGETWINYTTDDGLNENYCSCIAVDQADNVWVGGWGGVSKRTASTGTWSAYTSTSSGLPADNVNDIEVSSSNAVYFTTGAGLASYNGSTWATYTTANGLPTDYVGELEITSSGLLWIGTYSDGAFTYDLSTATVYDTGDGLVDDNITAMNIADDGSVWFGSQKGISGKIGSSWITFQETNCPASNYVNSVYTDRDGGMWFGTDVGVSYYDGENWSHWSTGDGLVDNYVQTAVQDKAGLMWFGTNGGLSSFNGSTFVNYTAADSDLPSDYIPALDIDGNGILWIGTGSGAAKKDGASWTVYTTDDGLLDNNINDIEIVGTDVWFTGWYGLSVLDTVHNTWMTYTASNGLSSDSVGPIANDTTNAKTYIGTYGNGCDVFNGSAWSNYSSADGLGENNVYALCVHPAGAVFFGTSHAGVTGLDSGVWTVYSTDTSGIASNSINKMAIAADGALWIATNTGVSRFGLSNAPEPPTGVTIVEVSGDTRSFRLTWEAPADGPAVTGYNVYRSRSESIPGDAVPISSFATTADLIAAEPTTLILVDTVDAGTDTYTDSDIPVSDVQYYYWVAAVSGGVTSTLIAAEWGTSVNGAEPFSFALDGAFPNPFNPATTIGFSISRQSRVLLSVYNMAGQKVRELVDRELPPGVHSVRWDGCDDSGNRAASGVYIVRMNTAGFSAVQRMTLVK